MLKATPTYNELVKKVTSVSEVQILQTDTGSALISEYGGRVLGLFPNMEFDNVLWTPTNIDSLIATHSSNTGGNKLWLNPQSNFYFENPRDKIGFHIPSEIDPAHFQITGNKAFIELESKSCILDYENNLFYDPSIIHRTFNKIEDPYNSHMDFIGLHNVDTITLSNCAPLPIQLSSITTLNIYSSDLSLLVHTTDMHYDDHVDDIKGNVIEQKVIQNMSSPYKNCIISLNGIGENWYCLIKKQYKDHGEKSPSLSNGPFSQSKMYSQCTLYDEITVEGSIGFSSNDGKSRIKTDILCYTGSKREITDFLYFVFNIKELPKLIDKLT